MRTILIPDSGMADAYRSVIVQDKTMTDKVEKGEMTRAQRQSRLAELIEQLRAAEEERAVIQMEKTHAEFMQRVDEMRRMRRLDGIMR